MSCFTTFSFRFIQDCRLSQVGTEVYGLQQTSHHVGNDLFRGKACHACSFLFSIVFLLFLLFLSDSEY